MKVQLGKGGQTLLPRLAAHPPLALCAYLYIRTCMHGRPIILFSSLILFQIHFDRFPTCFPSSTRKIVSFEKSREKLDGFDRWFSFFFFFVSSSFLLAQKRRAESTKGGERLNSMNKTRDQSSSSGMECEISILFFSRTRRRIIIIILILIPPSLLECIIFLEKRRIRIWNLEFSRLDRDLFIARRGGEESGEGKGWMKI